MARTIVSVVAVAGLLAASGASRAEDAKPVPPAGTPPPAGTSPPATPKPAEEPPLEGDALKKYDEEFAKVSKTLKTEKNRALVTSYIDQLSAARSRASRDALIAFVQGNRNQEFVKHAFDSLAKMGDAKSIEF